MNKLFIALFIVMCQSVTAQDTLLLITGRKIVVSSVDVQENSIAYRIDKGSKLRKIEPQRVFSVTYKDGKEHIVYQTDSLDPLDFKVEEMRNFIHGEIDAHDFYRNNIIKIIGIGIGGGSGLLAFYGIIGPPLYATAIGAFSPNVEKKLTFKVSGNAADALGISTGKYMNEVTGKKYSPTILKDQKLKICGSTFRFKQDSGIDSAVTLINSRYKCVRLHAVNAEGKLKLYKSDSTALIAQNTYREGFEKKVRDYKIRNGMISGMIGFVAGALAYGFILK